MNSWGRLARLDLHLSVVDKNFVAFSIQVFFKQIRKDLFMKTLLVASSIYIFMDFINLCFISCNFSIFHWLCYNIEKATFSSFSLIRVLRWCCTVSFLSEILFIRFFNYYFLNESYLEFKSNNFKRFNIQKNGSFLRKFHKKLMFCSRSIHYALFSKKKST